MVKIKKAGGPKHDATLSPGFSTFIKTANTVGLAALPRHLAEFPSSWPFPRGDLYHWIPLLNRFDSVLDLFNEQYGLVAGPQAQPFGRKVLRTSSEGPHSQPITDDELDRLGFSEDGDRQLVEDILVFSRLLLQNCGNRSLYSSSGHLNSLLSTTSLSLLHHTLRLAVCLAQRYHTSRQRPVGTVPQINTALLASHYNINLDNMQKLALPFMRLASLPEEGSGPGSGTAAATTPTAKGKERASSTELAAGVTTFNANDLVTIAGRRPRGATKPASAGADGGDRSTTHAPLPGWETSGDVLATFYPGQDLAAQNEQKRGVPQGSTANGDAQKTSQQALPGRRSSGLSSAQTPRRKGQSSHESDRPTSGNSLTKEKDELLREHRFGPMKVLSVASEKVVSTPIWKIMASVPPEVPQETRYELLARLRVASALSMSLQTRQQILGIRILAVVNLAYIYPEHVFHQKLLQQDTDEPRRFQLTHQLAELVHPYETDHDDALPRWLQTLALGALEALAKFRTRSADVATALNLNVNHGVLFYLARKAIAEMTDDDGQHDEPQDEEWRDAFFSLVAYLPNIGRSSGALVSAGLLPVLMEALNLRSEKAERVHPKVIDFLSVFVYDIRDPFQTLASVGGLGILSDLVAYEVGSGLERAHQGKGVPKALRNHLVDYELPFFQHQTLRRLFKFINHMMSQNGLTLDRLLRNLIDSPPLLGALCVVMTNASIFGSSVWSGTVDVMSSFIHNEPTSYAVIAESGLSQTFLEAVSGTPVGKPTDASEDHERNVESGDGDADNGNNNNNNNEDGSGDGDNGENGENDDDNDDMDSEDNLLGASSSSRSLHSGIGPSAMDHDARTGIQEPPPSSAGPVAVGILPSADAIAVVPSAFGAICLNSAGMRLFRRSGALPSFFEVFQSADHVQRMQVDPDLPNMLGGSFDELVRHHPQLRRDVMDAVISTVKAVCQVCGRLGRADEAQPRSASRGHDGRSSAEATPLALPAAREPSESGDVEMGDADAGSPRLDSAEPSALAGGSKDRDEAQRPSVSAFIEVLSKFLAGFFANSSVCTSFIEQGGAEWLLDLALLPNLPYDFNGQSAGQSLSRAVHKLVEHKAHLVLPSLVRLAQSAADELVAFTERTDRCAVLDSLKEPNGRSSAVADLAASPREPEVESSADELARHLVALHTVCYILVEAYRHHHSSHRSSHNLFTQVNLADVYQRLLASMGRLYRWCVVQQILLQKNVPSVWNDPSFIKEQGFINGEVDDTFTIFRSDQHSQTAVTSALAGPASVPAAEQPPRGSDGLAAAAPAAAAPSSMGISADTEHGTKLTRFNPFRKLRYLLSYTTLNFVVFFHELGKKLVTKRLSDSHQKKSLTTVAETIADVMIDQLRVDQWSELQDDDDRHACWIFAVTSLSRLLFDVASPDRPPPCLTVVLLAFKNRGGFDAMVRVLDVFVRATQEGRLPAGKDHRADDEALKATKALTGIEVILNFFLHTVTPKTILEAGQTGAMASRDRARDQPDYFSPAQFLVELKLAVLPPVQTLLEPKLIENASLPAVKKLVEVLGFIFECDNEQGAFRRSESNSRRVRSPLKAWKESAERVGKIVGAGYPRDLAREALYRCWDNSGLAEDYCALRKRCGRVGRHPIPEVIESRPTSRSQAPTPVPATASAQPESAAPAPNGTNGEGVVVPVGRSDEPGRDYGDLMDVDSEAVTQSENPDPMPLQTPRNETDEQAADGGGGGLLTMISIDDHLANPTDVSTPVTVRQPPRVGDGSARDEPTTAPEKKDDGRTGPAVVTLDDLDDRRETIRRKIIELALDILNAHGDVTFELADLIVGSVPRSGTAADSIRTEIGETLVQSLMSLQMDDDFRPVGKKVAAYAHLLALILHNKHFFDATLKELKSHLPSLLGFIKVFPGQSVEETSPWISQVLLIFERLLSEDALPPVCLHMPSTSSTVVDPSTTFEVTDPPVSKNHKTAIFDAVLEVLPRVGKDPTLALSVVRVLVILSRSRQLAARLGERRNLQRLFVMVKQLAGMTSGKLQSSFMLLLRHIVEDDETIKQIMRNGIHAFFDARTGSRQTDSTGYLRGLAHYALRNAELFVEVSKEMVKISKYDPSQRNQLITPKVPSAPDLEEGDRTDGADEQDAEPGAGPAVDDEDGSEGVPAAREHVKPSETPMTSKAPAPENKIPVVDHPDGVIHYLLCELLSYREVDDKEPPVTPGESRGSETERSAGEVEMTDAEPGSNATTHGSTGADATDKGQASAPATFKPDQHPIFIYRCFILQCLTELLSSYNRTKLEFINFTRKSPPHAQLSKPRSGVLSYFFHELIPVGTLGQPENIAFRKRYTTSNWAIMTIVGLCGKTGEKHVGKERYDKDDLDEPELTFVRKFVLEQALRAYRDAMASGEALDVKYARILSMADLFNRMLIVAPSTSSSDPHPSTRYASHRSLAKLMLEKSFVSAFTSSVAEIDLNYPSAKRAIKYILRPLKVLTETAVGLSNSSSLSSLTEPTDEDEIPSASSISEAEAGREETPDLFRNSTLGLFEPGREADSDSDTSEGDEDELYDDEYGDEMEYEEEEVAGEDNDLSEDDEVSDMEGLPGDVGLNVEVVLDEDGDDAGSGLEGSDIEDDDDDVQEDVDDMDQMDDVDDDEADEDAEDDVDNDEWESEDDDDPDYAGDLNAAEANEPPHTHAHAHESHESHLEHIVRALGGADDETGMLDQLGGGDLGMELDPDDYMNDDMQEEDDLSEDDEDEDELDEDEEVIYAPGFDDADAEAPNLPWGWGAEADEPVTIRGHSHTHHHHHHHHHLHQGHRLGGPWSTFSNLLREPAPPYRSHRSTAFSRGNDDGTHPLLHRGPLAVGSPVGRDDRDDPMTDWIHTLELGGRGRGATSADIPTSLINNLISVIGNSQAALTGLQRHGAALHFHLTGPPRLQARDLATSLSARRASQSVGPPAFTDPAQAISFVPVATSGRWQGEARLLFGQDLNDTALRVMGALLSFWVPPALEEEKIRKEKLAAEESRKVQKEAEERAKREREEMEKQKQKEEEERQQQQQQRQQQQPTQDGEDENGNAEDGSAAADRPDQETEPTEAQEVGRQAESTETPAEGPMEGVEVNRPNGQAEVTQAGPSSTTTRVRTTIRGRELDITGMDIDPEYLDALPEELREEVLMHQIAERRSQAASSGEQPTNISREFLEALPAEIRQELLEQETQDRRRREREEARRRAAATSGAPTTAAEDMDPASVLATLEPGLRQAILMEQDEDVLAQLPQEIAAEARALGSEHRQRHRYMDQARVSRAQDSNADLRRGDATAKKPQRRTVVQMLDKAGIATLLRLMFVPQQGTARHALNGILRDICENKQNRIETVSMLLSILQDGSADTTAIDRSFAQLSLRARQVGSGKSSQTPKRVPEQSPQIVCEVSPLAVVQQCLNTLVLLVQYNPHLPTFFLTEHDAATTLKRVSSKKGKMRDNKASRYALNCLLGLLDRKLVMESPTVMEQLSALLNSATQPLSALLRRDKEQAAADRSGPDPLRSEAEDLPAPQAAASLGEAQPIENPGIPGDRQQGAQAADDETAARPRLQATAEASDQKAEDPAAEASKPKKERVLSPPVVPEENLRLVVNILTARECSAKTFRDTLATINNLSAIPESKDVFGNELLRQARYLGQSILEDLNELIDQINKAESDTDVQGVALIKFSPSTSSQAKLLRVLTALDYLFDAQRESKRGDQADESSQAASSAASKAEDVLAVLAHDPTFAALWAKLSECLSAIRYKEPNMVNLATILLPLIESLMVVCKDTTRRTPPNQPAVAMEASASSLPKDQKPDALEELFFKFTEDHRKVLNELVRQSPKLMSGTFSLLVKNPKVLEFDNKRNYFTRRLHTRGTEARHTQPPLQLSVRRDHVFLDSFKSLYFKSAEEMKYGKMSIRFHGEEGVDAGGVTREWFQVLSRQMFNPDYALFTPVASDRTTFHPNRLSAVNPEHLMFFKFIGRIIGKALYEGRVLDCHFSRAVYKRILGKPVSVKDMETLDLDYYKSLIWMLENDITDIITETFSVETEAFGETQIIDLKENGRNIPVTDHNKQEYVRLVVECRLTGSVHEQLEQFLTGFHDVVPAELIAIFNEQELELLISGLPDIDVDDWKNNSEYQNYTASSPQIQWLWRAVRSFDKEERAKLLQFVTGTSKVPLNGFKELEGMNGFSRFNVHRDYGSKERLPSSHTCFNQLDLPEYESYDSLRSHLYTAMTAGSDYFGFA